MTLTCRILCKCYKCFLIAVGTCQHVRASANGLKTNDVIEDYWQRHIGWSSSQPAQPSSSRRHAAARSVAGLHVRRSEHVPSQTRLRSSSSSQLTVRPSRRFATGVPGCGTDYQKTSETAPSLTTFRQRLKTHLFRQSCPDVIFQFAFGFCRHGGWSLHLCT